LNYLRESYILRRTFINILFFFFFASSPPTTVTRGPMDDDGSEQVALLHDRFIIALRYHTTSARAHKSTGAVREFTTSCSYELGSAENTSNAHWAACAQGDVYGVVYADQTVWTHHLDQANT
jgi:hypothetical protein